MPPISRDQAPAASTTMSAASRPRVGDDAARRGRRRSRPRATGQCSCSAAPARRGGQRERRGDQAVVDLMVARAQHRGGDAGRRCGSRRRASAPDSHSRSRPRPFWNSIGKAQLLGVVAGRARRRSCPRRGSRPRCRRRPRARARNPATDAGFRGSAPAAALRRARSRPRRRACRPPPSWRRARPRRGRRRSTAQPACASRQAIPSPMTPAPMTTVFGRCGETTLGAVITDSLRRACPARFIGSDLSRCRRALESAAERHPSLAPMSDAGVVDARFFSRIAGRGAGGKCRPWRCFPPVSAGASPCSVTGGLEITYKELSYVSSTILLEPVMPSILVVDDNSEVREVVCEFLRDSGHLVFAAGSALQARALLARETHRPVDRRLRDERRAGGFAGRSTLRPSGSRRF